MEMHEEKKEDRTWAIVGTVAAIVLCGLPGLCLLVPAAIVIFTRLISDPFSLSGAPIPSFWGVLALCFSVVFIAIAVLVPVLTLRRKKPVTPSVEVLPPQDLPPAPPPPMPPESHIPPQPPLPPDEPLPPAS